MLSKSEAQKIQKTVNMPTERDLSLISEAERLVKEKPEWMAKKLRNIESKIIKAAADEDIDHLHLYPGWFDFAFKIVNRIALGIVLCEQGYYVSVSDNSIYITWNWRHDGNLFYNRKTHRRQGSSDWFPYS